jgi:hypothetical protein
MKGQGGTQSLTLSLKSRRAVPPPDRVDWPIQVNLVARPFRYVVLARTAPVESNSIYAGTQAGLRPTRAA